MKESSPFVDPAHFLRSFFVIAVHYVVLFSGLLMSWLFIAMLRFPEVYQLLTPGNENDRDKLQDVLDATPELLFPSELCLWLIGAGVLLSLFVGIQTAFWAPFSKAGHGIFLAMLSLVSFLQLSITQEAMPKWCTVALMLACPACIVVASQLGDRWFSKPASGSESGEEPSGEVD